MRPPQGNNPEPYPSSALANGLAAVQTINAGQSIPPWLIVEFRPSQDDWCNYLIYNEFLCWHSPCLVIGGNVWI